MRSTTVAMAFLAIGAVTGCNKERIPYLGHWDGGFDVTSSTASAPTAALNMRGYVQLWRTDDKFLIELANPLQVLDLRGNWRIVGNHRVELTFREFKLAEPNLDKLRGMRKPFLEPDDLRAAYAKPLILDLSPDGKKLTGLLMRVGPLLGKHEFKKGQ